jgi:hypothetical protein
MQGGATYILSSAAPIKREPNPTLIKAVAKAYRWNHLLITGQVGSMEEIAQIENIRSNYIRKLISLAWLKPTLVEEILNGNEPLGMTLTDLYF